MSKRRLRPDAPPTQHEIDTEGLPSASAFNAEFRCPGKRALCARLPREEDTAQALRGQRIHAALEKGDFSDLSESDAITASRIAYAESEIVHEYSFEGALIEFEQRVWDCDDELSRTWSAGVDRYDWQPDARRLLVIDDKTGWSMPPAVHANWQIRSEGALLSEQLDAIECVVALIHPHHPDSLWEAKVYTRAECDSLLEVVRHLVQQIQMPDQRRVYGGIQCQFCAAKRICPEYRAADEALDIAISDEIKDEGFTAILRRSKQQRSEHVRMLKEKIKNVEFILQQYVELMTRDASAIDGWRLARRMTRHVTSDAQAVELVRANFGEDALVSSLQFNIVALENMLAKERGRKKARESVERVLAPILQFKKSKYFLEEARSI